MNKIEHRKSEFGFNLIELMVVIAIIALLISVGGYAWQVMIRRGNETAAVSYVSKINTAQVYYASKNKGQFSSGFKDLVTAGLLDKVFSEENPVVSGYLFTLKTEGPSSRFYSINADPEVGEGVRATGTAHYYLDSVIHAITFTELTRPANADDPSL